MTSVGKKIRISIEKLGAELSNVRKIYLDTKFWVLLRDADFGQGTDADVELLKVLRDGVSQGRIICPISEDILFEIFTQADPDTRCRTIDLVCELSRDVALIPIDERRELELDALFSKCLSSNFRTLDQVVWTRSAFVFGHSLPSMEWASKDERPALQESYFQFAWQQSMRTFVKDTHYADKLALAKAAANLTKQNKAHSHNIKSYSEAYMHEAQGAADLVLPTAINVLARLSRQPPHTIAVKNVQAQIHNIVWMSLNNGKSRKILRSLHVLSSLHATLRWNKDQNFKANDFADFNHAVNAISYFDFFLTERRLASLLEKKHHGLSADFECLPIAKAKEATRVLSKLLSS